MNCPKCGHAIDAENVKFCTKCGAKMETEVKEAEVKEAPTEEVKKEEAKETVVEDNPYGPSFATQTPYNINNTPEKKNNTSLIVGIIAVVLVVALIFGLVMSGFFSGIAGLFTGNKTSKVVFYQHDDEIHMIKDVTAKEDKIKDFEVGEGEEDDFNIIGIDSTGKYFYYYSEYEYDEGLGTVCVIPIDKISNKSDKNEKATIEIADDVTSFEILDGGKAVYTVDDDELYYFDGKESYEIDDDVDYFSAWNDMVVYERYDDKDETYSLNYAKYSSKPKPQEIDDDISYVSCYAPDFLIYSKDEYEGLYDIYTGTATKGCEKIAEDATVFDYDIEKKAIWVGEESETELTLNDFFENDLDGAKTVKLSELLVESDMDDIRADYGLLPGDIEELLEFYISYYEPDETLLEETGKSFYELTSGYDADDNYCYFYYCVDDDSYWKVDYDAYYKAINAEETYEEFIEQWEEEKDEDLGATFYDLKYYKNGKERKVAENVMYTTVQNDVCIYSHISNDEFEKVSLKAAYESYLEGDYYALTDYTNYVDFFGMSYSISGKDGQKFDIDCDMEKLSNIYVSKDQSKAYAMINEDDKIDGYRVDILTNKNGKFEVTKKEAFENAVYMGGKGDNAYFLEDYDASDCIGDLYVVDGSKSSLVAKNVASDNDIFAFGDKVYGFANAKDYAEADFYRFEDGEKQKVASDVDPFSVYGLDEDMFVFIKDGNLYYTNGKDKPVKLAKKVDYVYPVSRVGSISAWD